MRAIFSLVGIVVALALVGLLAKKQLAARPAPSALRAAQHSATPAGSVRDQSQQIQQQVRQQVEGLMQQARPEPGDEK